MTVMQAVERLSSLYYFRLLFALDFVHPNHYPVYLCPTINTHIVDD